MRALASLLDVSEEWLRTGVSDADLDLAPDPEQLTARNESEKLLVQRFRSLSREKQTLVHQLLNALSESEVRRP